jgi:hypothetical protein
VSRGPLAGMLVEVMSNYEYACQHEVRTLSDDRLHLLLWSTPVVPV